MTNNNKNNNKKRLTLFINPAITKQARAQAVLEELSLAALTEKALIKYLPKETVIKKADVRADIREDYDP